MNFSFTTNYTPSSMTAMAKAIRKTSRKKTSTRSHIFGIIIALLAILVTVPEAIKTGDVRANTVITWIATAVILLVLIFEDRLNGYIAYKRMPKGLSKSEVTFTEDGFTSVTALGKTEFNYSHIADTIEIGHYFVFIYDKSHAQLYDMRTLSGGDADEFRAFISEKISQKQTEKNAE